MKRILYLLAIILCALNAEGQFIPIVNTAGTTAFYGSLGVTVTSAGSVSTGGSPCLGTPLMYWIGSSTSGSYTYTCSIPVYRITVQQWGLNGGGTLGTGEYMQVYLNGAPYSLTATDVTSYTECGAAPGYLFSGFYYAAIGSVSGGDFTINSCNPIYSFQLYCNSGELGTAYHLLLDTLQPDFCVYNNGPLCNGTSTLMLSKPGDSTGATYYWYGPGGFTSTLQNPTIPGAVFADSGVYHVVKTVAGISDSGFTHVIIKPIPTLSASSNTPVCHSGDILTLFAGPDSTGETFSWTGPNTFSSTLENPILTGFTAADTGLYTAIVNWNGCLDTATTHVAIAPPPAITVTNVCMGVPAAESDSITGGAWSSGSTGIATIDPGSGVVTGVSLGTSVISYSFGPGCPISTAVVTVSTLTTPVTGLAVICAGATTILSEAVAGGTWSSSNPSIASVGPSTGVVTGGNVSLANTALITYTAPGGCFITKIVTVNPAPTPVLGPVSVCAGLTIALSDPGGGTWSSSSAAIATIGSATGVVTGVAAAGGSVTITYTLPTGCNTTYPISVSPLPAAITGITAVCEDAGTTTLSDPTAGGYWTSNNTTLATIDPFSGVVTGSGVTTGVDTILYNAGCSAAIAVTVNPAPPVITGAGTVCMGSATTLSDAVTGGTWSSSTPAIASVGSLSGIVTGGVVTTPASVTITYTSPSGCTTSITMIVYPPPAAVTGTMHLCAGQSTVLADPSGAGTWTSSSASVAVVTPGPTSGGIVTGEAPGTDTVTYYTPGTGCTRIAVVTVNAAPVAITGVPSVCIGSTITFSNATPGGTWSSSNTAIATAGLTTGVIGGVAATPAPGTTTITYSTGGACVATIVVTVHALPAAILGSLNVCVGASVVLSDPAGAGLWTSSVDTVATITPATGTVSALFPGTTTITYTPATGCSRTATLTVSALPPVCTVGGGGPYCSGSTGSAPHVTLSCSIAGATYRLFNGTTVVSTVTGTGAAIDFGAETGAGTYTVTATNAAGCTAAMSGTAVVSISPLPLPFTVTGGGSYCTGGTGVHMGLSGSTIGIMYQLFVGGVAVGGSIAGTGFVLDFGLQTVAGVYTVVATNTATGCTRAMTSSVTVTISPLPVITGPTAVCVAATIAEAAVGFTGVTWTSSTVATAIVGATTGFVTGVVTGTTTITATSTVGCTATTVVTVTLSPTGITGNNTVCVAAATTESDGVPGGLWTCTPTSIATTGSLTGIVTGVNPGTVILTYSLGGSGCTVTKTMTVTPAPASVTGSASLCGGATTSLGDATGGGTWGTSDVAVASVTGAGSVTGGISGTATITYTLGGCTSTLTVTVNPAPAIITGPSTVCAGSEITLFDATGGGSWTSSNTAVATVDGSGDVWGVAPGGTATITYSLGGSCVASKTITVNPISLITGSTGLCVGTTTILSDATPGGTWNSSTAVATLSGSGSSVTATGALAGSSVITYMTAAGCTATTTVNVSTAPTPVGGTLHVCQGLCVTLTDGAPGGTWSSSSTSVNIDPTTGLACGITPGTATITYSLGSGCTKTAVVTVSLPSPAITGTTHTCAGSSVTLSDAATGGTWSSSNTAIAVVNPFTGTVTGGDAGTSVITYSPPAGCATEVTVTINPLPLPVTGIASLCLGSAGALSDATPGGTWASSNTGIATADPLTGTITSVSAGAVTITYTLPTGCLITAGITINSVPPISGTMGICTGAATTLSDPLAGGTWASPDLTVGVGTATGVVSGITTGTATVSYTVGGCTATAVVTVHSLPAAISGPASICVGSADTLADSSGGGTWSSSSISIATTDMSAGIVTGVSAGAAAITYSLGAGCTVTVPVIVEPVPAAITGITEVCAGYTTTLGDATGGGVWSSSNTTVATVIPIAAGAGLVTGATAGGLVTVYYTYPATGCAASRELVVIAVPPIAGVRSMCAFGSTMTVSDATTGGVWTSSSASVSSAGVVTAYSAGAASITYTLSMGCYTITEFTINPEPGPVMGASHVCLGLTTTLSDTTAGGTWTSGNAAIAPVNAGGVVTGFAAGTATVSYTVSSGCTEMATITVDTFPSAGIITGPPGLCAGTVIVLTDPAAGGAWSTSNGSASVFGGITEGVSGGADTVRYVVSNSCGVATAAKTITVNPLPVAGVIIGASTVCTGDSITLSDAAGGGVWSASNGSATVSAGMVRGVAVGIDTVRYSVTNSCGTADTATAITISTLPDPGIISGGADSICSGSAILLLDTAASGAWSVSNGHISITSAGLLTALTAGTDTIAYSITNSCGTVTASLTVTVKAAASVADTITGNTIVCMGVADTLTGTPPGGAWYSSNGNAAIIPGGAGAVISGVLAGADTIIYTTVNDCGGSAAAYAVAVTDCKEEVAPSPSAGSGQAGMLRVFPNPNDGVFTVILASGIDEAVSITITDIAGQKVKEFTTTTNKAADIKFDAASGIYFLSAATAHGKYVVKVTLE